jgi:hypothetical protein
VWFVLHFEPATYGTRGEISCRQISRSLNNRFTPQKQPSMTTEQEEGCASDRVWTFRGTKMSCSYRDSSPDSSVARPHSQCIDLKVKDHNEGNEGHTIILRRTHVFHTVTVYSAVLNVGTTHYNTGNP